MDGYNIRCIAVKAADYYYYCYYFINLSRCLYENRARNTFKAQAYAGSEKQQKAPYCLHIKLHTLIYLAVFMFNLAGECEYQW